VGLEQGRAEDFVVAVNEIATNSLRHGGGEGRLRFWRDGDDAVCEVSDQGRITDPLVGRARPTRTSEGGAGIFLANQFCDLVQVRSSDDGTVVRLRLHR
jgi:anti-sigma regulatory factor (Ser/Thr protein kinase)